MYALIYTAFYSYTNIDSISISELMSYVWLNQAFLTLVYPKGLDEQIIKEIQDGTVSYELCRPYNIYLWWFLKLYAKRLANCTLRFSPVIIVSLLLPKPYNLSLPISLQAFILFVLTLLLAAVLITTVNLIVMIVTFYTYQSKGISGIVTSIFSVLSGLYVPLPLFPDKVLKLLEYLPFRYLGDLSYRIYSGNIGISYGLFSLGMQVLWIIIFIFIGVRLLSVAVKKACIQGG